MIFTILCSIHHAVRYIAHFCGLHRTTPGHVLVPLRSPVFRSPPPPHRAQLASLRRGFVLVHAEVAARERVEDFEPAVSAANALGQSEGCGNIPAASEEEDPPRGLSTRVRHLFDITRRRFVRVSAVYP